MSLRKNKEGNYMTKDNEKILSSQNLHEEWNEEREKQGLKEMPVINNAAGTSTGNLARMDESWKSAPDFFKQMIKKNTEENK